MLRQKLDEETEQKEKIEAKLRGTLILSLQSQQNCLLYIILSLFSGGVAIGERAVGSQVARESVGGGTEGPHVAPR